MSTREPAAHMPASRLVVVALLLIAGVVLVAWSFQSPTAASRRAAWPKEQALAYQEAAVKLHGLTNQSASADPSEDPAAVRQELEAARAEYQALRDQLEGAIGRPRYATILLRVGGLLLAGTAAALFFWPKYGGRGV